MMFVIWVHLGSFEFTLVHLSSGRHKLCTHLGRRPEAEVNLLRPRLIKYTIFSILTSTEEISEANVAESGPRDLGWPPWPGLN